MLTCFVKESTEKSIPIVLLIQAEFSAWLKTQSERVKNLVATYDYAAKPNTFCLLTDANGKLEKVLLGVKQRTDLAAVGVLPHALPTNNYHFYAPDLQPQELQRAAIAWGMGSYKFSKYKKNASLKAKLVLTTAYNSQEIKTILNAIYLVRDLINTPADDMTPEDFAKIAHKISNEFGAKLSAIVGKELLKKNFSAIYTVGRASENQPRFLEIKWNSKAKKALKIALVGKGVCFDSGGLDLKSPANMFLMKKDMAGAAHALALGQMIMASDLPINLSVYIPLVENLVDARSYKPGDVIKTRKGISVEVKDTDAEGRLILSDALTRACEDKPDLLIDFASLTGAARVALGSEVAALFSTNDELAAAIVQYSQSENEHAWRMPLYQPYRDSLKSKIADLANISSNAGGGAITAALFLEKFVLPEIKWAHLDIIAYNFSSSPGKPEGGEAMCLQGIFKYLMMLTSK